MASQLEDINEIFGKHRELLITQTTKFTRNKTTKQIRCETYSSPIIAYTLATLPDIGLLE
jgi:hypothetical protein